MTRRDVFAALTARGADRAVIDFSGGNDEGGPDSITLLCGEVTVGTLPSWPAGGDQTAEEQALARLTDALSEPVFDVYHTFAGDFDVTGEVIWDVQAQTVQMSRDERSDYVHSEDYL
jgi:hypothetical protein